MKDFPVHVAIIMDGSRRWATKKGFSANKGHQAGVDTLEKIVDAAVQSGVKYLTVYALSTENLLGRSKPELSFLFSLMEKNLKKKIAKLEENQVRLRVIGDVAALPSRIQSLIKKVEKRLSKNERHVLNIALNYGSRSEIVQAANKVRRKRGMINEEDVSKNLYTAFIPDPDLIIRTGGQKRLSNFLLWQASYAEFFFTDTLWPDFSKREFKKTLNEYSKRKRNFGY